MDRHPGLVGLTLTYICMHLQVYLLLKTLFLTFGLNIVYFQRKWIRQG